MREDVESETMWGYAGVHVGAWEVFGAHGAMRDVGERGGGGGGMYGDGRMGNDAGKRGPKWEQATQ